MRDDHVDSADVPAEDTDSGVRGTRASLNARLILDFEVHQSPDELEGKSRLSFLADQLTAAPACGATGHALIMFDWDDTLHPTTWLQGAAARKQVSSRKLERHARLVEGTLRAARAVSRVAIVTLGRRPWVMSSAGKTLLGLDFEALRSELEINIYYAREEDSIGDSDRLTPADGAALKRMAIARAVADWPSNKSSARPSLVSIGDAEAEHEALRSFVETESEAGGKRLYFSKTVKLIDTPTLDDLGTELLLLTPQLRGMAFCPKDFDLVANDPNDLAATLF